MTRVLVTGSTGCVGANLVEALNQRDFEVVGLRRSTSPDDATHGLQMQPVVGDLLDLESLRYAVTDVDWVFHVAAVSDYMHTSTDMIYRVNVDGTRNLLQAAKDAGVKRVVYTSSTSALGFPSTSTTIMDENHSFNIKPELFPYAHSKHLSEQVVAEYVTAGLDVVTVLPAIVLGPRDVKFISGELLVQAIKGVPALPRGGVGYIDARDVALGHIAAAEKGRTGERYILSGHNLTHQETMAIIAAELGVRAPALVIPRWLLTLAAPVVHWLGKAGLQLPVDRARIVASKHFMYYDNSKAVNELGLTVRPFAESVRDTYRWYVDHDYFARRGINELPGF